MINQLVLIEIVGLQFMLDFVLFLVFLPVRNHAISAFSYGNLCNTEIHSKEMSLAPAPVRNHTGRTYGIKWIVEKFEK